MRIHIDEKYYGFFNQTLSLRDIDLSFDKGTATLVIGTSGAGKSTLIKCMTGRTSFSGGISGFDRQDIAYIPQFPALNTDRTILSEVTYSRRFACICDPDVSDRNIEVTVRKTLGELGIGEIADRRIGQLSGGQRQRVSIAKEVVREKDILIADELDTGLDVGVARTIISSLCNITHKRNLTTIIVSHNVTNMHLFDNLVVLVKDKQGVGRIAYTGTPAHALEYFDVTDYVDILMKLNVKAEGGRGMADHYIDKHHNQTGKPDRSKYIGYRS